MTHVVDEIPFGAIVAVRDKMLKLQAEGKRVMRLESGDPSFETPPHVKEAMVKALESGYTHYTPSMGIPELREAILEKLHKENRIPIRDSNHILVTNGAMHALYVAFRALLSPSDEVIIPDPNWSEIADLIRLAGGVPVPCPLDPSRDFLYDASAIDQRVTPRTVAVFINTPHNPTGSVVSEHALRSILEVAERRGLTVVSDEAYEHVIYDGLKHASIGSLPGAEDRAISIFSFSKSYAMSGLRLGYLATNKDKIIERGKKLLRCTINGVSSATQYGGVAALRGPQDYVRKMAEEYQARRDLIHKGLQRTQTFEPVLPKGTFFAWARISEGWEGYAGKRDSWAMTNLLLDQAGVGSSPGIVFGPAGEGYVRFAFSCPREQIEEAVETLTRLLR